MTLSIYRAFLHKMTSSGHGLLVPINVRGMKVLDRAKFSRGVRVSFVKTTQQYVSAVVRCLKPFLMKVDNFKPVQTVEGPLNKCIFFNPNIINKWEDIEEDIRGNIKQFDVTEKDFGMQDVQLGYDNWTYEIIFRAVFPEGEEIISGFSQIGHIIHLNLRDHLMDYRQLIGQVLVDKIKKCRTVVIKSSNIDNTYRNFEMEVIAGEEDFIVKVKENNCTFQFDFSKVYWNPRLAMEHERIIGYLKAGDVLFDVFSGVGPFAIPACRRKCKVFANDLNPESFKWLNVNAKKNSVRPDRFKSYNLDGKDFILNVFKNYLVDLCENDTNLNGSRIHITMNLPAQAVEFLKYFKGLIKDEKLIDYFKFDILVYVYCFAHGDENECVRSAKQMINDNMACDMTSYIVDVFNVRKVSPTKDMMRVIFKLTKDIIFDLNKSSSPEEPPSKKQCVEN